MYIKLAKRNLLSHKQSGLRLFFLLFLCGLAVMLCLGFRKSFSVRYRALGIDVSTANLQILPLDSPKNQENTDFNFRKNLITISYSDKIRRYLEGHSSVEGVMPIVETNTAFFTLGGESLGYSQIIGIDPEKVKTVLPGIDVDGNSGELSCVDDCDIPILQPYPDHNAIEYLHGNTCFQKGDFIVEGQEWELWKRRIVDSYSALFQSKTKNNKNSDFTADKQFIYGFSSLLNRDDLLLVFNDQVDDNATWEVDDAVQSLKAVQMNYGSATSNNYDKLIKIKKKIFIQSIFPQVIRKVKEAPVVGMSCTMSVFPPNCDDIQARPIVMPVKIVGFVQRLPYYFSSYYIDRKVLLNKMVLPSDQCTSILIKLKSEGDLNTLKNEISLWLKHNNLDYVVQDSDELGKTFLINIKSFELSTLIVMFLFVAIISIFIFNTVKLTLIKRRREIGTSNSLGFSNLQNGYTIFLEMLFLAIIAWTISLPVGVLIFIVLVKYGLPGIVFFPEERLYFVLSIWPFLISFVVIVISTIVSTVLPLLSLKTTKVVDLLKES